MDVDRLIEQLEQQGELLARSAEGAALAAPVPSCPGWTIASALGHTAKVHRTVSSILHGGDPKAFSYQRPEEDKLLAEYRASLAELVTALRRAPDNLSVYTFWPARSSRQFWARRQAHETAIHAVDVQLAAGYGVADLEPDFAADGVDELVMNMAIEQFRPTDLERSYTVAITPLDANIAWTVRVAPDGVSAHRGAEDGADLNVLGLSSDLYRWVWNRAADHEVSLRGELSLADRWHAEFTVGARRSN